MMNRTAAIMQPYFFPYLGYFSLVRASDVFVFYDDVNFITRGWINRNRILLGGKPFNFTVPLSDASQNSTIMETKLHHFPTFRQKFLTQLHHGYKNAPFFEQGMSCVQRTLAGNPLYICDLAIRSVIEVCSLVGIQVEFLRSSEKFGESNNFARADRLIEISKQVKAVNYVNGMGGLDLYDKAYFHSKDVNLEFVKPNLKRYQQLGSGNFEAGLSIIDVLMNLGPDDILHHIDSYDLL